MSEHKRRGGRLRGSLATLSRLNRLGDIPVVVMLAWAGWLAVPWSFNGLAQARAAAAAAADTEPPPSAHAADTGSLLGAAAWGIPAPAAPQPATTVRPTAVHPAAVHPAATVRPAQPLAAASCASAGDPEGEVAELARAAERARIAGEVHDAAGHGLAAIAMQAGLALVALDDDPEQARASLRAIRETSTAALAHLRAALDGIDPPAADLPALIAGVRAAGLPVDVDPADPAVPAHLRTAVYRVVRESLTNVLRHAGPTRASVRLAHDPYGFVLEVADRGAGWDGAAEGRGLAGMRAHVIQAGGRFAAGPREGGGFRVTARFPEVRA
ncbi:sensor histidine kinase [Nonomuraea spiralis]|uniref:histidine kinase n=1 Tax=Nonomuraea spiralis TaxID=46182 RepID=A0ABV5IYH0_9ACTN|nr:histidine kinase [Nonomuraea spiralis]